MITFRPLAYPVTSFNLASDVVLYVVAEVVTLTEPTVVLFLLNAIKAPSLVVLLNTATIALALVALKKPPFLASIPVVAVFCAVLPTNKVD